MAKPDEEAPGHRLLSREETRSLWLHRGVAEHLEHDPDRVLAIARRNIQRWLPDRRPGSRSADYLREWSEIIDRGPEAVMEVLQDLSEHSRELRPNSPFPGVLTDHKRLRILDEFREYWRSHEQQS